MMRAPAQRLLLGLLPALACLAPASSAEVSLTADRSSRMTVPVMINGRGPYHFVVDTGAERTVISHRLASELGLPADGTALLHSMSGTRRVRLARIGRIQIDGSTAHNLSTPLLREGDLGGPGMVGIDSLTRQRVTLDLRESRMTIEPGIDHMQTTRRLGDEEGPVIVVRGRRQGDQLVLTDAMVGNVKARAVIDTGAQGSIGNMALRRRLMGQQLSSRRPVEIVSVTGDRMPAQMAVLPRIEIGRLSLSDVPLAFADAHPFSRFGLADRPAILLGMDILGAMDRVSIDFASRTVLFVLRDPTN